MTLDAQDDGVWLMSLCRCRGFEGIAAPLSWTPWLLTEI